MLYNSTKRCSYKIYIRCFHPLYCMFKWMVSANKKEIHILLSVNARVSVITCTAMFQHSLLAIQSPSLPYAVASQFWRSVEHPHGLRHQTTRSLGTNHTHLQIQPWCPIFWDACPHHRHSALWLSDGKTAGCETLGAVYWLNGSWQGGKLVSHKKCYLKLRAW